jgi:hypothetical protein
MHARVKLVKPAHDESEIISVSGGSALEVSSRAIADGDAPAHGGVVSRLQTRSILCGLPELLQAPPPSAGLPGASRSAVARCGF